MKKNKKERKKMKEKTLKRCIVISYRRGKKCWTSLNAVPAWRRRRNENLCIDKHEIYTRDGRLHTYRVSYCNYVHIFVIIFSLSFYRTFSRSVFLSFITFSCYKITITDVKRFHVQVVFRSSHLWFDLVIDEQFSSPIFMYFILC